MQRFCDTHKEAFEQENEKIFQELDQFSKDSLYDIWIAYVTRKNPRTEEILHEDIEMITSIFLSDAPIATPIGITRTFSYFSPEKKPHKNLAMQLHGFWAKASELVYGEKLFAVTYPTPHMYKIMEDTLRDQRFGCLTNGLANYPARVVSLGNHRVVIDMRALITLWDSTAISDSAEEK